MVINLRSSSFSYYMQNFPTIAWNTDTFEQLGPDPEGSMERNRANRDTSASQDWIGSWTMFYWGWWISWSPFVGKVSFSTLCVSTKVGLKLAEKITLRLPALLRMFPVGRES